MISNSGKFFINWRKFRVWRRKHGYLIKVFFAAVLFGGLLGYLFLVPHTVVAPDLEPTVKVTPSPEPTPKWIKTKNGGEYREDICEQFEYFEVSVNGEKEVICPKPTEKPINFVPTTSPNAPQRPVSGKATYYSVAGCIGCDDNRVMANGERLDDAALTVAYNHAPLNSWLTVTNAGTGQSVRAKVTDRGGFEKYGKIIDLSVATKNAIGCGHVCEVALAF